MVGMPELFIFLTICLGCLCMLALVVIIYLLLALNYHWPPFGRRDERFPRDEYYVRNQVVLAGAIETVNAALTQVRGVRLERLERLNFSDLGSEVISCEGIPQNLVVDLYRIGGLLPNVERAIRALNETAAGMGGGLSAEPNYLSGHPWSPEGSPWEPSGSPWSPEGSPWSPEGSPSGGTPPRRSVENDAQPEWFLQQWAFDTIELAGRPEYLSGENILVGVFDTSPYNLIPGSPAQTIPVAWVNEPSLMSIEVSHPRFAATFNPSRRPTQDVRNHGLFASGLVHALAPAAHIQLVRVLASDNRGDLFTLVREIFNFLKSSTSDTSTWTGVVINLSLGIRVPPEEAGFNLPAEVRALDYVLRAARCLKVVVTAAAGNESGPGNVLPANLPAQWEGVISVAASNIDNQRACFSNQGVFGAPGGDGGPSPTPGICVPHTQACDDPSCGFGVVGPVLENAPHTGFIFWSGSSFSCPMVSGLVALVLQSGHGEMTPAQVEEILRCGVSPTRDADIIAGIINVRRTLTECLPQSPRQEEKEVLA